MSNYSAVKRLVLDYFCELEKADIESTQKVIDGYMSTDHLWEGVYPFLDQRGAEAVAKKFWIPLKRSLTQLQRRQDVFIAGTDKIGKIWVMSMGHFLGLFDHEFLGVAPTYKMQHLQYAEFCQIENEKIVHTAMFVDLLGFMNEAGQYPLPPMTGSYFVYPGPRDHNGLLFDDAPAERSKASLAIVDNMIDELQTLFENKHTPEQSLLSHKKYWAEDMIWYGPCGIGASYTIPRYQNQHHHPFCDNLIDLETNEINAYFAEGDFVCFYTSLEATPTGGFLGLPGSNINAHMRGDIDIYYCKEGKISENWCFVDIPYWLNEQGLDVFKRQESIRKPSYVK